MAIMVGTGRGATAGILVRNAEALERLSTVDTLFVDKTGTLTEGKPAVTHIAVLPGVDQMKMMSVAAALELHSEHPLAAAIVHAAATGASKDQVSGFSAQPGGGIQGVVGEMPVAIGTETYLQSLGIDTASLKQIAQPASEAAESIVFLALNRKPAGILAVSDPLRPTTRQAIAELRDTGIHVVMLTGDTAATAEAVAKELGIDFQAGLLPQAKAAAVASSQQRGHRVAMAGDGINDAPALAQATVGIAMGTGTDVAIEAGGITLLRGDLMGVLYARRLSVATMRNIRQNLLFAFLYNALGVPLAAGVLMPFFGIGLNPMIAAAAMSLSSVSVIANSLRLRTAALQ
jgi:Cu+-exporting ATPase